MLSTPSVAAARAAFPGATIHYLTFAYNREILELLGCADHIHVIETRNFVAFILSTLQVILALRRVNIDMVFDIEFFAKFPLIIATLIGAKRKAGFYLIYESWRRHLLDDIGYYDQYWHIKDIFLSLVYLVKENDPHYLHFTKFTELYTLTQVPQNAGVTVEIRKKLAASGWQDGQMLLLFNPNAGKDLTPELKHWANERWATLTEAVLNKYPDAQIIYTGASSESFFVESIISLMPRRVRASVRNGSGLFSLGELLALFSFAKVFVTIDSGPMHLAALSKVPVIGLFFAETPVLYAPLSQRAQVLYPPVYNLQSFAVYMGKHPVAPVGNALANLVSVEDVFAAIEKTLQPAFAG